MLQLEMTRNFSCYRDLFVRLDVCGLPVAGLHFTSRTASNQNISSLRTRKRDGKQSAGSSDLRWEVIHIIKFRQPEQVTYVVKSDGHEDWGSIILPRSKIADFF